MKKEIEVYANKSDVERLINKQASRLTVGDWMDKGDIKITLVIEEPEKEIRLTETMFDEAFFGGRECYDARWYEEVMQAKSKLFSKSVGEK